MIGVLSSIVAKIGLALLTEKVVKEVAVKTLWYLAQRSHNKLDDEIIQTVADGLGVKISKEDVIKPVG